MSRHEIVPGRRDRPRARRRAGRHRVPLNGAGRAKRTTPPAAEAPPAANDDCPGCGSDDFRTLFSATDRLYRTTTKHFEVVECRGCGLLRLFPRPRRDELAAYYPREYWFAPGRSLAERLEEAYRRFVIGDHVSFVRRSLEESHAPGPVLDVGCGGGLLLRMLQDEGRLVLGLDASPQAAAAAWKRNGVAALAGDLTAAALAPRSCAVITMFDVLERLADPSAHLNAARELLHDDGRLIVQAPNADSWQFLLLGEAWNGVDVPRHLIDFRTRDLEELLGFCGFSVLRRKFFSLRDSPAGLASSIAPGLDPMARRVRGHRESEVTRLLKDLVYFGLVVGSVPFTVLEAACRAGSSVMLEARKKP